MIQSHSYDIIIIGGGAIGLSLAWRLLQGGASVGVFEQGRFLRSPSDSAPEGQATIAAAGMLAPLIGTWAEGPLLEFALQSFRLWPAFSQELSHLSVVSLPIEGNGILRLTLNDEPPRYCSDNDTSQSVISSYGTPNLPAQLQECHGLTIRMLDQVQIREFEPALNENVLGALFSPDERQVQPRRLLEALTHVSERAGACLYADAPVEDFRSSGGEVLSVETAAGSFQAGQFVLASGAWTGLLAEKLAIKVPIVPVRGQMLAVEAPGLIHHALFAPGGCLIPQADGRVLVGSTEEDAGFWSCNTAEGIRKLLRFASNLVPEIADKPLHSTWAGLRPAAADGLPVLGAVPGWRNLHIASGHFRKGILLTPITAAWMSDWILRGEQARGMEAFSPARFRV